ncbi:uncharacterized protein MONOS_17513 [Monocercomonoides exilis]|uniref:uncharacterized protein n=1 Tax=Monocercomonoides exilis TaxID=2049356 RepID=UPI00355AC38E|nr:hypothetical protein MONOS_17513 [Monocercomonoides exilis]
MSIVKPAEILKRAFPEGRAKVDFEYSVEEEFTPSLVSVGWAERKGEVRVELVPQEMGPGWTISRAEFAADYIERHRAEDGGEGGRTRYIGGHLFYGCKHYLRECKVLCGECGRFFSCRVCHDKVADHVLDRRGVAKVWCCRCKEVGRVGRTCEFCENVFARYYCEECHLRDMQAGAGRGGGALQRVRVLCGAGAGGRHKCHAEALRENCPVCFEGLFETRKLIFRSPCGHCFHTKCIEALVAGKFYDCPLCHKPFFGAFPAP